MLVKSVRTSAKAATIDSHISPPFYTSAMSSAHRGRLVKKPSSVAPIKEEPQSVTNNSSHAAVIQPPTPMAPIRRQVVKKKKAEPSEAGTEHAISAAPSFSEDLIDKEKGNILCLGDWRQTYIKDPVFGEILHDAAQDQNIHNTLCTKVIMYVRDFMNTDIDYKVYSKL